MIAGHRWEYQFDMRGYRCVGLPLGGVESHQWCIGCGCFIGKKEIKESGFPFNGDELHNEIYLDILAAGKGYEPIESGTLAEWKLKRSTNA